MPILETLLSTAPYWIPAVIGAGGAAAKYATGGKKEGNKFVFGQEAGTQQIPNYDPETMNALRQLLQMGMQGSQPGQYNFGDIAQQARENYSQNTIPGIAERFTTLGAQGSGAFARQLAQSGQGLETNLASLGAKHGLQQQQLSQNLLGLGLTPHFQSAYFTRQPGFLESYTNQLTSNGLPALTALGQKNNNMPRA